MKILLLQSSAYIPSLGGANKANRLLLEQLAGQGWECHVINTAGGERATTAEACLAELAAAGVEGAGIGRPGVVTFRHAGVAAEAVLDGARLRAHAAERLRELAPDRVLVSSEDPAQMLLEAAVDVSPHTVYIAHTTLHLPFGPDGFLQSPGRTELLRRTAGIIAVSGYVRDYFRRWAGLEATVLRFPVYGGAPHPALGDFDRGFVTLINPCAVKGISIFLELARRLPEAAFAAVPTWGTTEQDLAALAALPNVTLLVPAANVDEIFARTRVLLAPSLWGEAFGQVAVEAMLRGIPVLASDAGGLPEAKLGIDYVLPVRPIERYEERFDERKIPLAVVPAQDVAPWETALRRVLADRELYERLARESRQAAQAFVAGLGSGPFVEYLEGLPARLAARPAGRAGRKMKILLVQPLTYLFSHGGAHKTNRLVAEGLAERGHLCRVVAPRSDLAGDSREHFLGRLDAAGIAVRSATEAAIVFTCRGVEVHATTGGQGLCAEALRQVRELDPDWTIVTEDPTGALLGEILRASPSRVVYWSHSQATLPCGPASFDPSEVNTARLREVAGVIVVSRFLQDYVRRWAGVEAALIHSPAYGAGPFPALAAFDRGWVTMINPSTIKGLPIFAGLARRMPDVEFAAVPTWGTTAADRELLAALPNMTLLPAVDDLNDLFDRVRILVVPSLWGEAFGQVVIDALLRGIPVVTSDQGGLPEAGMGVSRIVPVRPIVHYEPRLDERGVQIPIVPEQDLAPWEATLRALLSDRAEYERASADSRHAAAEFFARIGIEPYERFLASLPPLAAAVETRPAHPTEVRRKLEGLSPERLELLARRLRKKEGVAAQPEIPRLERPGGGGAFPLSFTQARMWFMHQLAPETPFYNEAFGSHLRGGLSLPALAASVGEIVDRHELLRTRFEGADGDPMQVVSARADEAFGGLQVVDLGALPRRAAEREAERLAGDERRRPFDLARGPLLRVAVLRLAPEDHHLLITVHHITADMWAIGIMMRELSTLYAAFHAGRPSPLPPLALQYADFAVWQRQWLAGERLDELLGWWRRQLAGMPPLLELPADRPRPAVQSFRGTSFPLALSAPLSRAIRELARRGEATLFMALLAGFQALLHRATGQDDLAVGSPIANRGRRELEGLIGCFINTLVLRGDLSGRPTGRELLARTRSAALGAYAHQDLPFELLVERLQPERSLSHGPLFQVMFMLHNTPGGDLDLPELATEALPLPGGVAKLDLLLLLYETAEGAIHGSLEWSHDLFDAPTVRRLVAHFTSLLAGMTADPDRRIDELPLLSAAERHQLLRDWNDTAADFADRGEDRPGLHQLFERQARRTPGAPAAAFQGTALTYHQLDSRAGRLAGELRALGCGPESRVAVAMERSLELVTALLGVLKTGAAYVPLDPEYPADRLAFMMADARPAVLITQRHLLPALPPAPGAVLLLEAGDAAGPAGEWSAAPLADLQLAYVIYTSGSTGRPKGAMVHHGGIRNRLLWMQEAYRLGPADTVLQKTPFSFDVSVWEFFWPLLAGARLVLAPPGEHRDTAALVERIRSERVTVLHFVPSMLQAFLEEPGIARCAALRLVVASGEALSPELVRRFQERLPGVDLENLYGPTEASVDVTFAACAAGAAGGERSRRSTPIGRPVANTQIHLLGPGGEPAPAGVAGELSIGGVQVGRGYLDRPALTAEKFVPDPFGAPGARLYRTGDLARRWPDGTVEFLGRIDHQVKIRGFRIELGEVEAALAAHPAVHEALVTAREREDGGGARLVAYVTPADAGSPIDPDALREALRAALPEPMVPSAFVVLAAFPLTPNGKLDRAALPAPEALARQAPIPLRTAAEEAVAAVWSELLRAGEIGAGDNFFDLGGDSIQAVRLVSRVNQRLGSRLRVQDVFRHQTVAALAAQVTATRERRSIEDEREAGLAQIERLAAALLADPEQRRKLPHDWEEVYPLSGIEKGMVYYSLLMPEEPIYHDQTAYLVELRDPAAFRHAFALLARRHPVFRCGFHLYDFAEPMKVVRREVRLEERIDVEDLSALAVDERRQRIDAYRASDLAHRFTFDGAPLWRLKLFRLEGDLHASVWTWHHALLDGWSNISFWVELAELCARPDLAALGQLPPLASSYKDYVAVTLGRQGSAETAAFWRRTLAGAGRNKLPFNRSAVRRPELRGMAIAERALPAALLAALRARALEQHVPLQGVFLAAHLWLLHVTSGEDDVVTGVVSHDRPGLPDADRVLGCFLSTFPVRLDLGGRRDAGALLRAAGAYLAGEKEHEIPLAEIAVLAGLRETSDNPIFDTLLNYMNFHVAEAVRGGSLVPADEARQTYPLRSQEMTNTLFDLEVSTTGGELLLRIKSSPKHFDPLDVDRAADLYTRILEAIAADPAAPVSAARLLSAAEREEIVVRFNDTARAFPRETPLHGFFEAQAARAPRAVAVVSGGESLTYGALDERADRLAGGLIARGVRPGENVGLCCERSLDLAAGLLAILKAGAAYVPLEPGYPAARKGFILAQSAAARLLADRRYDLEPPPGDAGATAAIDTLLLGDLADGGPTGASGHPSHRPRPEDLAYTIYTSGSTGRPKGVMIEHAMAANLVAWVNRAMEVGPDDRLLMVSSACFDLSVYDLFGGLAAGAAVVIAGDDDLRDPARLDRLMRDERITFWNSTPSTLAHLVKHLEESEPGARRPHLRTVFLSGDWIPLSLPDRVRRVFPAARVVSLGGATEATVWSNVFFVDRVEPEWASIPYGRPIDNNSFYVLDRRLDPVPPGVVGDLYIGGAGVARGYAGEPERTAAAFLPDPFAAGRMYRTGDLARMLPEGVLEFMGRADHQVKIRGFRVELGEIESRLRQHPAVREAVVVDRADLSGEKLLCAYVVAPESASAADLRAWLAGALPEYMIPAAFVSLPELPLTANGKLDRRALPDPDAANLRTGVPYAAPGSELEAALVDIWSGVLGLEGIGVRHEFFEIGGHSLSAVRVLTQIRQRFGVDLPLREFFEAATIEQVARAIAERSRQEDGEAAGPRRRGDDGPAPLSYAQERLWFLYLLAPESPAFHLGGAVRLSGELVPGAFAASLDAIVRRHEMLRTRFLESVDGPLQAADPAAPLPLALLDLAGLPRAARERELRRLAEREMARPFDLARDWPLRVHLVRLEARQHAALFNLHHIAGDGWSLGLLIRELGELYAAAATAPAGDPPALPALPIQYADFAAWQRDRLRGERLDGQLAWWRRQLAAPLPTLELPQRRGRPETPGFRGAACPLTVPADLRRALAEIGHGEGATPFMTLLAGFAALLHLYSGQEDLIVGTNVANRDRVEIEGLIGFFVNNLALRIDLSGEPDFRTLVRRVRDTALGAYAHQEVPFEKVLEAVQPRRQAVFAPLFQVMFVLQNFPDQARQAGGLEIAPLELAARTANFDLTLMLSDEADGLAGAFLYDTDLFEAAAVARMAGHLLTVLRHAADDPERPFSSLRLAGEADVRQLTGAFSEDF